MRIDALALRNFRNYDALNVTFAPDCNVIVGENAQGKTNLLEAIVYLSSARSPRARAEKELISFGKSECSIKANAFERNRDFLLEIALAAGRRRKILINKVPVKKGSDLSDVLGAVYFCPEDLLLIRDGAAARRRARCCAPPRGLRPLRCCPPTRAGVYVSFVGFSLRIAVGCLVSESLTANNWRHHHRHVRRQR